jgi:hypothetical protein
MRKIKERYFNEQVILVGSKGSIPSSTLEKTCRELLTVNPLGIEGSGRFIHQCPSFIGESLL